uniref:Cytochrome b6 n=1 Tax=Selaginella rossii TaxID=1834511 RepID=A0A650FRW0_9TRAC|nr:cytochrome b6 [Selaginella rossii]
MGKVYDRSEERPEIQAIADDITSKYAPPHANTSHRPGGITSTCSPVQVATGPATTPHHRPTATEAPGPVRYTMTEVNFGRLIRSVHRWPASTMVSTMIPHAPRVHPTGGSKKPREPTRVTGVTPAASTVPLGATGHSSPRDQIGHRAVKTATGVPEAIPVIGSPSVELSRGSVSVGQSTSTRSHSSHTSASPLLTAAFTPMHFPTTRKQGIPGPSQ